MTLARLAIATRGSALALWQAEHTRARLIATQPGLAVELVTLTTQGDRILDVPLAQIGGKALFVKEIEQALLDGRAQVAVHSMKDLPAELAPGLILAAVSTRELQGRGAALEIVERLEPQVRRRIGLRVAG